MVEEGGQGKFLYKKKLIKKNNMKNMEKLHLKSQPTNKYVHKNAK